MSSVLTCTICMIATSRNKKRGPTGRLTGENPCKPVRVRVGVCLSSMRDSVPYNRKKAKRISSFFKRFLPGRFPGRLRTGPAVKWNEEMIAGPALGQARVNGLEPYHETIGGVPAVRRIWRQV